MISQIIFIITLLAAVGGVIYSFYYYYRIMKLLRPYPIRDIGKRIIRTFKIAFAQTKILKRPVVGLMHALVFWGFMLILFGSIEMVIDGITGKERTLAALGTGFYNFLSASWDIFSVIIGVMVLIFIIRRTLFKVKRFEGVEMTKKSHLDALLALVLIFILMVTLLGMNTFYYAWATVTGETIKGYYPVSKLLAPYFTNLSADTLHTLYKVNWWIHIETIFIFANILPYSKHFHVYLSIPNVFLSRTEPLGKIDTMHEITNEVKALLNPDTAFENFDDEPVIERFGVYDADDVTWKMYLDSLTCTQCGRCTSVCPANITGKLLSPRKLMMNLRERMSEKAPGLLKEGKGYDDGKALIGDYITPEEIWACTMCNACANECPVMVHHPTLIVELRRYLVMEANEAPAELNAIFQNIENNGAPWQFSKDDRMLWAEKLELNGEKIKVPIMAEEAEKGHYPEYLFWVGSAGAIDDRYKKVIQAFVKILHYLKIDYAVLGTEESDTGDVARRAGNEMTFQMQALRNIEILNKYKVKKIITCDPHDFNTLKHEYPDFGGNYEVIHHTQFLQDLINKGVLKLDGEKLKGTKVTYHDPCYLGRINKEFEAPRFIINRLNLDLKEMPRNRQNSFCCGAGGAQMFKEAEKGKKEIFIERTEEAIGTGAEIIVTACPFCMTMLTDGIKYTKKEDEMKNYDIAELVAMSLGL